MNSAMNSVKEYVGSQNLRAQTFLTGLVSPSIKKYTENILNEKNIQGENVLYNWKVILVLGLLICIPLWVFFLYISPIVRKRFNSELFANVYSFFLFGIFVNCAFAIYTVTHYYYRLGARGMNGPRGYTGKNGKKGKNTACDVDKVYHSTFTHDEKPIKRKLNYNLTIPNTVMLNEYGRKEGWNAINGNMGIGKILAPNGEGCLNAGEMTGNKCEKTDNLIIKDKNNESTHQAFQGVIVDYDPKEGTIYSIQFLYNTKTNIHREEDIQLFGERYGSQITKGKIETFICPPGSALFRVEVLISEDKEDGTYGDLKGISFQARNIQTGNLEKLLSNNGNYSNKVFFGIEPKPNHKQYRFLTAECGFVTDNSMKLKLPGFFSGVNLLHSSNKLNGLQFTQCSYFRELENPLLR
jgi:hypothetical protein